MKPNFEISPNIFENQNLFVDDFYKRFTLRHASEPILLENNIKKNYLFPTFYGDTTCAMSIHLCDYEAAMNLVESKLAPGIKPVEMTKNRAIIAFSCYEYKQVLGVPPYNEVAMAIPILVKPQKYRKIFPMLKAKLEDHFGYYIASMPVTSKENMLRGHNIWGLPKITQEIEIQHENSECITKIFDEKETTPYLTIRVPTMGKTVPFDELSYLYTNFKKKLVRSKTCFKQNFNVNKNMGLLLKKNQIPKKEFLKIGTSNSAQMLKELKIELSPFQQRYAEHLTACFDFPEANPPEWVHF